MKHTELDDKAENKAEKHNVAGTSRLRRRLRFAAWTVAAVVCLLVLVCGAALLFLRSDTGEAWLTRTINEALHEMPDGLSVRITALHGPLPSRLELSGISLSDEHGEWLTAEKAELRMDWSALPGTLAVMELSLDAPRLLRLPDRIPTAEKEPEPSTLSSQEILGQLEQLFRTWPGWLPGFRIDDLNIRQAGIPAAFIGTDTILSLQASAAFSPHGASLSTLLTRDDANCHPVSLRASLSPSLELNLQGEGSDLGLIPQLIHAMDANALFSVTGSGNAEHWQGVLDVGISDNTAQKAMLTASAQTTVQLTTPAPEVSASLTLETGPAPERLWTLAGQKNGHGKATLTLNARQEQETELTLSTTLELSEMVWSTPLLTAMLGPSCTLTGSGTARTNHDGAGVTLDELTFRASRLHALTRGSLRIPDLSLPLSAETEVTLHTECGIEDTGKLSPDISGSARFTGEISGVLKDLNTTLALKSDRLQISGHRWENMDAGLELSHTNVARLVDELPRLTATMTADTADASAGLPAESHRTGDTATDGTQGTRSLLTGRVHASGRINGQKTALESRWNLDERNGAVGQALRLALDTVTLHLEDNSVEGHVAAEIPLSAPAPKEGTVAAMLGMPAPALDGELHVRIRHWAPLSRISGQKLSGTPLHLNVSLSSEKTQQLTWKGNLNAFQLHSTQGTCSLTGMKTDIDIHNLWGMPELDFKASLQTLTRPGMSLSRLVADAHGNGKGMQFSMQSQGDIRSELSARWKPNELSLNTLSIDMAPAVLGLAGNDHAGISLENPAVLKYGKDTASTPGLSLNMLPAGRIHLSGAWSPGRIKATADISGFDLGRFRTLVPGLPAGLLECRADLGGTIQKPSGNLKLNLRDIRLPGSSLPPVSADITGTLGPSGKRRVLALSLDMPEETLKNLGLTRSELALRIPFSSSAQGLPMPDMHGPLRGTIVLSGELGQLWKLLPLADQRLSGMVDLTASISGTPSAPVLTLHTALDNGRFADLLQGVELRNIRLRADADNLALFGKKDRRLTFELSADDSRKGSLALSGWLAPATMRLSVDGHIDHLSPLRRQDINIMLSGSFGVDGSLHAPAVRADITVEKGQIQLAGLPGGDIVTLPIDNPGQTAQTPPKAMQGSLNVRVRIPNQFFIRGYGLECEWRGDIRARGTFAQPDIIGSIQAVRGGLDVLGKHFTLAEGRISFDGGWPVSPQLNIVMAYESSGFTADVTVGGSASKPDISLSSQPAMPQDEIISQIMFGQSAGTLSHVQALQLAAGAAELAGLGSTDVMGFGRRLLGLDVFKLNSENTGPESGDTAMSSTSLEMGTYVRDNVYVGVEQGIGRDSDTGAVVEIELTPSLEAQAKASTNRTEFGLEWKKNY